MLASESQTATGDEVAYALSELVGFVDFRGLPASSSSSASGTSTSSASSSSKKFIHSVLAGSQWEAIRRGVAIRMSSQFLDLCDFNVDVFAKNRRGTGASAPDNVQLSARGNPGGISDSARGDGGASKLGGLHINPSSRFRIASEQKAFNLAAGDHLQIDAARDPNGIGSLQADIADQIGEIDLTGQPHLNAERLQQVANF